MWTEEDVDFLRANYGKIPYPDVREALNHIDWQVVRRKAGKLGLTGNDPQKFTRDSAEVNHDFFAEVTPLSAYVAGFIAADGCIVNNRVLQVSVNDKDERHLIGLLKAMKSTANLTYGNDNTVRFSIPSTKLSADLYKHYNITPRKSLTLMPPNIILKRDIKAFISGYIDGDGCFRYGAQSKTGNWKYLCLEVVGTRPFLQWMSDNLPGEGSIRDVDEYARLSYTCKKAFEIYNYLHDPTLPLLDRKWDNRYKVWSPRETNEQHYATV